LIAARRFWFSNAKNPPMAGFFRYGLAHAICVVRAVI
jgi:hypothetical protein